ncbi:MAG TPA: hypothetical protein VGO11_27195 [Chthoniobacteraceae bacterium]|jgi:hypothetical protein|nr:hypothetical protein [Chthoniobacteraceae bacterium]
MKNFLLLVVIVILAVYLYRTYVHPGVPAPTEAAQEATPAPPPRATPTPPHKALETSGLQTHSLDRRGPGTPAH